MISPDIDLTEHNDFSSTLSPQLVDRIIADEGIELADSVAISIEELDWWLATGKIFGRRIHPNRASEIFRRNQVSKLNEMRLHCARCGKSILPWRASCFSNMNVCSECESILDSHIPTNALSTNDDRGVLQMR